MSGGRAPTHTGTDGSPSVFTKCYISSGFKKFSPSFSGGKKEKIAYFSRKGIRVQAQFYENFLHAFIAKEGSHSPSFLRKNMEKALNTRVDNSLIGDM